HHPETHLIPNVLAVPLGQRSEVDVYGTDYPTRDGTAVRDYLHVADLGRAHLLALAAATPGHRIYNLGTGTGDTLREGGDACAPAGPRPADPGTRPAAPAGRPADPGRRQRPDHRGAGLEARAGPGPDRRRRLGVPHPVTAGWAPGQRLQGTPAGPKQWSAMLGGMLAFDAPYVLVHTDGVTHYASGELLRLCQLADLPRPADLPVTSMVPSARRRERGSAVHDGGEPILTLAVREWREVGLDEVVPPGGGQPFEVAGEISFDVDDAQYAEWVRRI